MEGDESEPLDEAGKVIPSKAAYVDTWKAMEVLVDKGLTKSIGPSNFNKRQIERVMEVSRIKPAVLQSQPVTDIVKTAIDVGYRHFDCASLYYNEEQVGAAFADKIKEGVIKRADIFVTSKLGVTSNRPELVEVEIKNSLQKLGLEYLDLYLIHWPQSYEEGFNPTTIEDYSKAVPGNVDYVDVWKAMENLVDKGLTKSIGLSNFNKRQIGRVMEIARINPAVLQIEVHPYLNQVKLINYCTSLGIKVTACAPLGSPERPWAKPTDPVLLDDQRLKPIADKYGKSLVQVLIRYAVERGLMVIPKSAIRYQIEENFNVFDFKMSPEDMKEIAALECNFRFCNLGDVLHPEHPFNDEY